MAQSYTQLRAELAHALASDWETPRRLHVAREAAPNRQLEMLVQAIWFHQLFRAKELRTASHKPLTVLSPGRWNRHAGPDFLDAQLKIGDDTVSGDVEIHVRSSDWERHRHGRDFEYNSVVLHAFLECDDGATHDVLHNGRRIERLALAPVLVADLETLSRSLATEELDQEPAGHVGRCRQTWARLDAGFVRRFFHAAARERMEGKIRRVLEWTAYDSLDQVLYQMILTMLGHKASRVLYYVLARRVPIEELKDILLASQYDNNILALESIFLHVAALVALPEPATRCEGPPPDPVTRDYLEELARWWSRLGGYYQDRLMEPTRRWYSGLRPVSFPERRLAGLARVLVNLDVVHGLAPSFARVAKHALARHPRTLPQWQREIAAMANIFCPESPSYWSHHYTLGGKTSARPIHLIGRQCGYHLVFNAVLPVMIAYARMRHDEPLETFLWHMHDHFPALETNSISRFMRERIAATMDAGTIDWRFERNQQALLHIFQDCCRCELQNCDKCVLLEAPSAGSSSAEVENSEAADMS